MSLASSVRILALHGVSIGPPIFGDKSEASKCKSRYALMTSSVALMAYLANSAVSDALNFQRRRSSHMSDHEQICSFTYGLI